MSSCQIKKQIQSEADEARNEGSTVIVDPNLPSVSVRLSNGSAYDFQESEALALLEEFESRAELYGVSVEDAILYSAVGW